MPYAKVEATKTIVVSGVPKVPTVPALTLIPIGLGTLLILSSLRT